MSITRLHRNPYVGPRSFLTGEKLYGRDREVRQLLDLLIAERIVLLHSPSGAGKSSLVQAGILPCLEEEGFRVLPIIRINLEPPADLLKMAGFNRYVFSALLSLEEGLPEQDRRPPEQLATLGLDEYLDRYPFTDDRPESNSRHPDDVLIFDQFEEILTLNPADRDGKAQFFAQIGQLLRNRGRWGLFVLREDYLAALEPFVRPLPTRLSNTFRLDLLGVEAAKMAIRRPAQEAGIDFTPAAVKKLVDDLSQVQLQLADGTMEKMPGPYVEPVQLQVVCFHLWQKLDDRATEITEANISVIGNVDQSLAAYYAEQVAETASSYQIPERAIREWFDHHLITEGGIRGLVLMEQNASEGLDNRAIKQLVDAHLVRAEKRSGATWYELAHDRLIQPVHADNAAWFQSHLSLLQRQAVLWQNAERAPHLLLRDQPLQEAEAWARLHTQVLTPGEREFLKACLEEQTVQREALERAEQALKLEAAEKVAEAERRRAEDQARSAVQLRRLLVLASIAALAAVIFAGIAFGLQRQAQTAAQSARDQETLAKAASTQAIAQRATAEHNAGLAQTASAREANQRELAEAAGATARAASTAALAQKATAEYNAGVAEDNARSARINADVALSRQLGSQALNYLNDQPDLAALLSITALQITDTWEAKNALLNRLQRGLDRTIESVGRPIPGQADDINTVALSPDNRLLAWGSKDRSVVAWSIPEQKVLWRKFAHSQPVNSVVFSPDGKVLASSGNDTQIILWDPANGQSSRLENVNIVLGLSFSPDSQRLAAGVGSQIAIWDVAGRRKVHSWPAHTDYVYSVAWSPDGATIASGAGGADRRLRIWDAASGEAVLNLTGHTSSVWSLAWSPDSNLLASASADRTIRLWDVQNGKASGEPLRGHQGEVQSISFNSDGKILASGGSDTAIIFWDIPTRQQIGALAYHIRSVRSVAFSRRAGDNLLASGSFDNSVGLHSIKPQEPLEQSLAAGAGALVSISSAGTPPLRLARLVGRLQVLDIAQPDRQFPDYPTGTVPSAALSLDGQWLAVGDGAGKIEVFETQTGEKISSMQGLASPILSLAFSADRRLLAASQCANQTTGDEPLARSCEQNEIWLWEAQTGRAEGAPLSGGHTNFITALAFDPQRPRLASGSQDRTIQFWDLTTRLPTGLPLSRHTSTISSLAFSADGKYLASGSGNASANLILWDVQTSQPVGEPFRPGSSDILSLAFSEDNQTLFSGTNDGELLGWEVGAAAWIERACRLAGRNLTQDEWNLFLHGQVYRPSCSGFPVGP